MKNFNTRRFGQVLKYEFATNYRTMLWYALGVMLAYVIIFWFVHQNWSHYDPNDELGTQHYLQFVSHSVAEGAYVVTIIVALASACLWLRNVQQKAPRIVMLMLPATNLEKFLARWVYLIAFTFVATFVSFLAADLLHALYLGVHDGQMAFATDEYLRHFVADTPLLTLEVYVYMLFFHSFALMSGVLFKRFHVVAALASWMLLFAVVGYVLHQIFPEPETIIIDSEEAIRQHQIWTTTGALLGTALWTFLAYRIFCRWQVVTRKFVNL